ncbi:MAG: type II secretion system protein, partial [Phycisphaerales bacterium]
MNRTPRAYRPARWFQSHTKVRSALGAPPPSVVHSFPSESHSVHRRGLTLIELLVCIAVIAVLLGILLPTLTRARSVANRSLCASNL